MIDFSQKISNLLLCMATGYIFSTRERINFLFMSKLSHISLKFCTLFPPTEACCKCRMHLILSLVFFQNCWLHFFISVSTDKFSILNSFHMWNRVVFLSLESLLAEIVKKFMCVWFFLSFRIIYLQNSRIHVLHQGLGGQFCPCKILLGKHFAIFVACFGAIKCEICIEFCEVKLIFL